MRNQDFNRGSHTGTQTLRVDRHVRVSRWHRDDDFRLQFVGGRIDSCAVGWAAFNALADGGSVAQPLTETFFAKKWGMLKDKFGVHWMVIASKPMG